MSAPLNRDDIKPGGHPSTLLIVGLSKQDLILCINLSRAWALGLLFFLLV